MSAACYLSALLGPLRRGLEALAERLGTCSRCYTCGRCTRHGAPCYGEYGGNP